MSQHSHSASAETTTIEIEPTFLKRRIEIEEGDHHLGLPFYSGAPSIKVSKKVRKWWGSCRESYFHDPTTIDLFFKKLLARRIAPAEPLLFLDIGANTGSYCLLTVLDPYLECVAYEPNKEVYEILCENIDLNALKGRLIAYNIGLWNEDVQRDLKIPLDCADSGLSTLGDNTARFIYGDKSGDFKTVNIECRKLDTHLEKICLNKKVDAIKIDTEGAELFVLQGAEKTLKRDKPMLLIEYDNTNTLQFGYRREEIVVFLHSIGYAKFTTSSSGTGDLLVEASNDI